MWKVKRRERYALIEVDETNPLVHRGTFHIGPRHVKHHASKEFVEHAYVENPDFASERDCRVFAQCSNIAVEVYDFYNKLFDPDYEKVSVYDERFEVQYLFKEKPKEEWRSADYYNPRIEVIPLEDGVDIKKTFDTDYGSETLEITYTVRTGTRLKHTIVFTNKTAEQRTFRVVMKLAGITSDKVKHRQVEERVTEEKHIVSPFMFFGEDNQHLKLSEYLWSLGETDEETKEWHPTTLKDIVLDVHAQGCKADIIIGNYPLAENESLSIDPDSDTWSVDSSTDDCTDAAAWGFHTDAITLYFGHTQIGGVFGVGMRWDNVTIPSGATITAATVEVQVKNNWSDATDYILTAEDADDPITFSDKTDYDARDHTSASVSWDPESGVNDDIIITDDITACIQEVIDRGGWASGQAMVVFSTRDTPDGVNTASQIDDSGATPPKLLVTWTAVVIPTVTTQAATGLTVGAGTLHGTITDTGGENADERGFDWDYDSGAPYAYDETDLGDFGVGTFEEIMSGFTEGNTVYFRAKANNSAGWGYGGELNFVVRKAITRSASAAVGLVGATDRAFVGARPASGAIGITGVSTRAQVLERAASAALGLTAIAAGIKGFIRTASASMGLVAAAARSWIGTRPASGAMGVVGVSGRGFVGVRSASASITIDPWLDGWAKRVKVTLDHNDIDSALSDFPHLVYLSATSGHSGKDVSCVFDELGSDAKKIAITRADGITQCYVEIEKWDDASEQAWLWVKVPDIDPDVDTELYLYYDSTHADNDANVGVVGSGPGEAVWGANFLMVQHQAGDSSPIRDSTSNDVDMTEGGDPTYLQVGPIDGEIDYDGNDYHLSAINVFDAIVGTGKGTMSLWIKTTTSVAASHLLLSIEGAYMMLFRYGEGGLLKTCWSGTHSDSARTTTQINTGAQFYIVSTYDGINQRVYVNGVLEATDPCNLYDITGLNRATGLASNWNGLTSIDANIDEVRVSKTDRSAAWIKASYESGMDHLNDFGSEEIFTSFGASRKWVGTRTAEAWMSIIPPILSDAVLVAHMDEGQGNVVHDYSSVGNDGTVYGASWVDGKFGKGLESDGFNDYIQFPYSVEQQVDSIAVEFWIKLTEDPDCDGENNWRWILNLNGSSSAQVYMILEQNRTICFSVRVGNASYRYIGGIFSSEQLTVGVWAHLIYAYDAITGDGYAYKDFELSRSGEMVSGGGVLDKLADYGWRISHPREIACPIGAGSIPAVFDGFRIYGSVPTEADIKLLEGLGAQRKLHAFRDAPASLSQVATAVRSGIFTRAASGAMAITGATSRMLAAFRSAGAAISTAATATRRQALLRTQSASMGVVAVGRFFKPIIEGIVKLRFASKTSILNFVNKERTLQLTLKTQVLNLTNKIRKLKFGRKET